MVYLKRKYSSVLIKSIRLPTPSQIILNPTNYKTNPSTIPTVKTTNNLIPTDKTTFPILTPIPLHKIRTKTTKTFNQTTKTHRIKSITYRN